MMDVVTRVCVCVCVRAQAVSAAVCAERLAVLSNQRVAPCRAAAVRALGALTRLLAPDRARLLHAIHYYLHLANQVPTYLPTAL